MLLYLELFIAAVLILIFPRVGGFELKVLFIAPFFPPDNSVGAIRMGSLARFLLSEGAEVTVLKERTDDVAGAMDSVEYIYANPLSARNTLLLFYKKQRQYRELLSAQLEKDRPDCAIISGGPFYTFSLCRTLESFDVPCIVDYRDPWFTDVREDVGIRPAISRLLKRVLFKATERDVFRLASYVTTVTDAWAEEFRGEYPFAKTKVKVVYNGFDDALMPDLDWNKKRASTSGHGLTLGVFGKLFYYSLRYSEVFLDALRDYSGEVLVAQVGDREGVTDGLLQKRGLSLETVSSTGFIDYEEGVSFLHENVDAFVIVDSRPHAIGTKIYDYIFLQKPIMYVGPKDTDLAAIVASLSNGIVCSSSNEVARALETLSHEGFGVDDGTESSDASSVYARSVQNIKMMVLMEKAAGDGKGGRDSR